MRPHFSIIVIAVSCLGTSVMAQTEKAPAPDCPADHELVGGTLCLKFADGDSAIPAAAVAAGRDKDAKCHRGQETLVDNQCKNPVAGDIAAADKTPNGATQSAKK